MHLPTLGQRLFADRLMRRLDKNRRNLDLEDDRRVESRCLYSMGLESQATLLQPQTMALVPLHTSEGLCLFQCYTSTIPKVDESIKYAQ